MYHTLWKLMALTVVVGVGVGVVMHAQRGMQENDNAAEQQASTDRTDDDFPEKSADPGDLPDQGEPEVAESDDGEVTPAIAKMRRGADSTSRIITTAGAKKSSGADADDPFAELDGPDAESQPSKPSRPMAAKSSRKSIDILEIPDEDADQPAGSKSKGTSAVPEKKGLNRPRGPVLTLDEPDEDSPLPSSAKKPAANAGPRLLGGDKELAVSESDSAAADDPFADDEPIVVKPAKKSPPPRAIDDDDLLDEVATPPARLPKSAAPLDSKPIKRDSSLEDSDRELDDPAETVPPARRPAELGKSIEVDDDFQVAPQRISRAPRGIGMPSETADDSPPAETRSIEPPAARRILPQVEIEKIAPATAVLGRPMVYTILVRNTGSIAAHQVVVEDVIPSDVQLDGTIPRAQMKDDRLIWKLGTLAAGEDRKISVRVIPRNEGTIGGVATVNFAAEPTTPSRAAGPQLKFDVAAPRQVAVGTPVEFNFKIRNIGTVPASSVTIRDVLPAALRHPEGDDLEYNLGEIAAGKTQEVKLVLTAAQAGPTVNRIVVTADGNVAEEAQVSLEVVGPSLAVARSGPKRLFPNKTGHYVNTVTNPGKGPVSGISVVETVPAGLEFVEAGEGGAYNAAKRTITWTIKQMSAGESKSFKVTLRSAARATQAQISVVRAYDGSGASGETFTATQVAGVPALTIEFGELPDLVEAGETLKVPVRILNRGSDTATGVKTTIALPPGLQLVSADGPTSHREAHPSAGAGDRTLLGGKNLEFAPIAKIEPRADVAFELTLTARTAGAARLEVQVQCDQLPDPIRREEVTTVVTSQ
jgi:uncharacterized repeat protein (TIGR01451 family)